MSNFIFIMKLGTRVLVVWKQILMLFPVAEQPKLSKIRTTIVPTGNGVMLITLNRKSGTPAETGPMIDSTCVRIK